MQRVYIIIIVLTFCSISLWGQKRYQKDTAQIVTPNKIYFQNDTIELQDSLHIEVDNSNFWQEYINNRRSIVGKTISKWVISPYQAKYIDSTTNENTAKRFEEHQGKKITKVEVKVLPPYGMSVYDTNYLSNRSIEWYEKIVNATHFKTSKRLITRQLTSKVGSIVDPFILVQEEISLKTLKNIDDVLIILTDDPNNTNAVIMHVICKDNFSWNGALETDFTHSFEGEVSNTNMFGLGQYIEYRFKYDAEKWKRCGNIFRFEYPNIVGTHINASIYYRNDDIDKILSIGFEHPFLTNQTKWAGGVMFERVYYSYNLPDKTVDWVDTKFNYRYEDMWIGHTKILKEKDENNRTLHFTGRLYGTNLKNRTDTIPKSELHFYKDRVNFLLSLQYTSLKYYKGFQIFDLGRSEFVPSGYNIGITGGYEWCHIQPSGYLELFSNYSYFNHKTERYTEASLKFGAFLNSQNGLNRGMLSVTAKHISNPLPMGDFIYRIYGSATYTNGIKRYPNEYLFIEDTEIRGFKADSLYGNQKLGISVGATAFSPLLKYDFRVAMGAFVDMGVIAEKNQPLTKSKSYFGVGLQLNIQNNNILIKNLSIRLAYYPRVPSIGNARDFSAIISSWSKNEFYNYKVEKPQMTVYK